MKNIFFKGFFNFLFKLLPKFIHCYNSDNCIGKITSHSISFFHPVFIQKGFKLNKKAIVSSEKMRNSGN